MSSDEEKEPSGARVLIAEDDEDTVGHYRLRMQLAGIPAWVVRSSAEALAAVLAKSNAGECYDLIVSDLLFKGEELSGVGLAEKIRETGCDTPIVFMTSRYDKNIDIPVSLLNIADVWHKPEDIPDMAENIMAFLKKTGPLPPKSEKAQQNARDRKDFQVRMPSILTVMLMLLTVSVGINGFILYRSIYTVGAMRDIQKYVVEKSDHVNEPPGIHRIVVPNLRSAHKVLKDGRSRVIIEFPPSESQASLSLAAERDKPIDITFTRRK